MADLYNNIGIFTPDNLIAGHDIPLLVKSVKVKGGQGVVKRGSVLALETHGATAIAEGGGNTGDAAITTAALAQGAQVGVYVVKCIQAPSLDDLEVSAIAVEAGYSGDAEIATATLGISASAGSYSVRCVTAPTAPGANDAMFAVFSPSGFWIGDAKQEVAFTSSHLTFTVGAATAADSAVGDTYTITVAPGNVKQNDAVFSVLAPDGSRLDDATQGVEYAGGHLTFTVGAATAADSAVGDTYTITVAPGSGRAVMVDKTKVDGGQIADCVLATEVDTGTTTPADVYAEAYSSGHFNRKALIVATGDTAAGHEAELRGKGIFLSDNISY